mmetsp:Transcript_3690/g.9202  ORF Transcript_3690/g.9202 Transcript_3690/m.9202 type:complete len:236 (+) Transcript_3690:2727-3434(+)
MRLFTFPSPRPHSSHNTHHTHTHTQNEHKRHTRRHFFYLPADRFPLCSPAHAQSVAAYNGQHQGSLAAMPWLACLVGCVQPSRTKKAVGEYYLPVRLCDRATLMKHLSRRAPTHTDTETRSDRSPDNPLEGRHKFPLLTSHLPPHTSHTHLPWCSLLYPCSATQSVTETTCRIVHQTRQDLLSSAQLTTTCALCACCDARGGRGGRGGHGGHGGASATARLGGLGPGEGEGEASM